METKIDLETCANCGRPIGVLETPHIWQENVVCAECRERLGRAVTSSPPPPPVPAEKVIPYATPAIESSRRDPDQPIVAYGLTRGMAWAVAIIGVLLTPALIGLPLLMWSWLAEKEILRSSPQSKPVKLSRGFLIFASVVIAFGVTMLILTWR